MAKDSMQTANTRKDQIVLISDRTDFKTKNANSDIELFSNGTFCMAAVQRDLREITWLYICPCISLTHSLFFSRNACNITC